MLNRAEKHRNLHYLYNSPKTVWWRIVAGPPRARLSVLQDHDLIFDDQDLKKRGINERFVDF